MRWTDNNLSDIRKLIRIEFAVIILFIVFKSIRPTILEKNFPEFVDLFLLSFPNFCEALAGTMVVSALGLIANGRLLNPHKRIKEPWIYIGSVLFAAIYVILQEFKIHNLGGENVYDPMDVLFSIAGLITAAIVLFVMKPVFKPLSN